jgi:hypothetical protein
VVRWLMGWWLVVAVGVELRVCQLKNAIDVGSLNLESNVYVYVCFFSFLDDFQYLFRGEDLCFCRAMRRHRVVVCVQQVREVHWGGHQTVGQTVGSRQGSAASCQVK